MEKTSLQGIKKLEDHNITVENICMEYFYPLFMQTQTKCGTGNSEPHIPLKDLSQTHTHSLLHLQEGKSQATNTVSQAQQVSVRGDR